MKNAFCGGIFWAVLTASLGGLAAEPSGEQLLPRPPLAGGAGPAPRRGHSGARGAKIPGAVDALVAQLRSSSPRIRVHALAALGQFGPAARQAAKAVMPLLADPNVHVRRAAVRAFRDTRPDPAAAIPPLINVLEDPDPAVKIGAIDMLAELGRPAVPALDPGPGPRQHRLLGLPGAGEIGADAEPAVPALQHLLETSKNAGTCGGRPFSAWGPSVRRRRPPCAALVRALDEEDRGIRIAAAYALGQIGPAAKAAVAPLRKLVDSNQPVFLRTLSVWAVARINPDDKAALRTAIPMLLEALKSREPRLRAMASRALVDLRTEPDAVMPSLMQLLAQAASRRSGPDVMNVLAGLGDAGLPGLIKALELKEVRPRAAAILARLGPAAKEAVPALIRAVQADDPLARHEALLALGAIGPAAKAAVPAAVKALQDLDPNVRYSACYALGKIGPPAMAAKDPLQQVLTDSDPFLSLVAAWALARIAPDCADTVPKSVPLLIRRWTTRADDSPGGRQFVALPRGRKPSRPPRRLKKTIRDDPSDLVRDMAAEALQSVQE